MTHLRQFCATIVLTFMFTLPAFAGEMGCPVVPSPPPPPQTITGDMGYPITATGEAANVEAAAVEPWMEVAFTLLRSMIAVF
jgi:hypothetical protein